MSSAHLLLVTIGPIQDFIAQARRTRDLWFGSHALSELSRAAAKALADEGARLIFPALDKDDGELNECDQPTRSDGRAPVSIANKILAVADGLDPETLAKIARCKVTVRWRAIAGRVKKGFKECLQPGLDDLWDEQITEIIEFYAAWVPLASDGEYPNARSEVEQALASRKLLRDFASWRHDRAGAPKSSLDGARASVLTENREKDAETRRKFARLRISAGEQLDAVGLVKRAGFEPKQFVPIMNVAAVPWLIEARKTCGEELDELGKHCEMIGLGQIVRNLPVAEAFRHDASVLYPDRWPSLFKELKRADINAKDWGRKHVVEPILGKIKSSPSSYVACLAADGDRMGKTLDELKDIFAHRDFSEALAKFPSIAREIVENHLGSLVYAGGDDVLAFLPVATAPLCALALTEAFGRILDEALKEEAAARPTLSVGIGIGHVLEAMGDLLALGREAEKVAKNADRDALAIIFDKRSGGRREWAAKWGTKPVERLIDDAGLLAGSLATGKVYEIGAFLRRFRKLADGGAADPTMLDAYVEGILSQSEKSDGSVSVKAETLFDKDGTASFAARHGDMSRTVERLLLANALRANGFPYMVEGAAS